MTTKTHQFEVGDVVELSGNFTYLTRHWEQYEKSIRDGGNRGVIKSAHIRDGGPTYQIDWDGWNHDVYSDESCLRYYDTVDEEQVEAAVASILQPNTVKCDVPECDGGYIRLPVVYEEVLYGHAEKFVRFEELTCGECKGFGRRQS